MVVNITGLFFGYPESNHQSYFGGSPYYEVLVGGWGLFSTMKTKEGADISSHQLKPETHGLDSANFKFPWFFLT